MAHLNSGQLVGEMANIQMQAAARAEEKEETLRQQDKEKKRVTKS